MLRLEESNDATKFVPNVAKDTARGDGSTVEGGYIKLEDASYNWGFRLTAQKLQKGNHTKLNLQNQASEHDVLSGMSFELTPGEQLIVVGAVGAGKTSLLHAIMNETNHPGGEHTVRGRLAYVE